MQSPTPSEDELLVRCLIESRALQEPTPALTQWAIDLWEQRARPHAAQPVRRRLLAILVAPDVGAALALSGLRTASAGAQRQLLFSLEGRDVDVRVRHSGAVPGNGWVVSGQVLGPDQDGRTHLRCGRFEAEVQWSPLCEFHFEPVPQGECVISLVTEEWEAVLPAFELQASA